MAFSLIMWVIAFILVASISYAAMILRTYPDQSPESFPIEGSFRRRKYLMDTTSEFKFFQYLEESMGHRFYVFPQVNIGHLVSVDAPGWRNRMFMRNRIDRKSVDFVLCDRDTVAPRVAIELDGSSHQKKDRKTRDLFVGKVFQEAGLPFVRIAVADMDNKLLVADRIFAAINQHDTEAPNDTMGA